jgi:required for meiotic nuclear division protein 1
MAAQILPVDAFAIASTVTIKQVATYFSGDAERIKVSKTTVVVRYDATAWAVAHDFGVLVFIGNIPKAERDSVLDHLLATAEGETRPPLAESFSVELDATATPAAEFNRVVLPELDARSAELVALAIGQSVGMEYYEETVDELVSQLARSSRQLADSGRFRSNNRELLRFIGRGMTTRTQVVHTLSLLDAPALAWDSEELDRLYRDLRLSFAFEDRYRALDQKLHMIQDNLELLVDLAQHKRSVLLEVAVIGLIAAEIVLAIVRH